MQYEEDLEDDPDLAAALKASKEQSKGSSGNGPNKMKKVKSLIDP